MKTFSARFRTRALLWLLLASPFALSAQTFTNVTPTVGLPQTGSSSVSWGDYDNDGRLDLLAGGTIWRNTESGFTNVTALVAPGLPENNGGSAWVDFDGDGRVDLFITGYRIGTNGYYTTVSELWRNTGSGFTNVTASVAPGLTPGEVAWGDYDNDGRLDFLRTGSFRSEIWRNTGSNFVNVTATVAPGLPGVSGGIGRSVAWGDYDNDGRLDFIITGGTPRRSDLDDNYPYYNPLSQLWRNTGSGFVNVTVTVAPNLPSTYWGSVEWGDYDNDGRLDLLIAGYNSGSQIFRNTGNGLVNVTASVAGTLPSVIQGPAAWGDYDNDGWLDILFSGYLYRNTGNGFIKATATDAPNLPKLGGSHLAWGDYNNDGRLDFVFSGSTSFCYYDCDEPSPTVFQLWQNNVLQTNAPPAVITRVPSNESQNSAMLNAGINPRGQTTAAWFIWGNSTNYGQTTAAQLIGNGNSLSNFSDTITGLSTGVTYYYRVVGSNDQGQVALGVEQRFTLLPPSVTTSPIGNFRPNIATIKGQVTPNNLPTYGWFEWGLTPALDQTTPVQFLRNGLDATLSQDLFGIAIGTTFYFRAVVSNNLGVAYGAAQSLVMIDAPAVCPNVSLSPSSKSVNYAGGAGYSVHAVIGCPWIVINTNSWITITSATNGTALESTLTFNVATNYDAQSRSGNITIAGRNFLVSQGGNTTAPPTTNTSCLYSIYPIDVNHGYGAATNMVYISAPTNCAWTASITNSWITILSGASGVGSSQVVYAVEANTSMFSRSGNITIGDRNYAITQAGHTNVSLPADQIVALGGTATFSVTANVPPPFTYQWQFNGLDLVDGGGLSGATTATLVLTGVQYSQGGHYRCVARNSFGVYASSSATLTVAPTANALPLAEAADTGDALFWKTWGNSQGIWFGQTNTTHDGIDALECSGLAPNTYASLEAKSGGPGVLSFWWKTDFATPSDSLLFSMGNSQFAALTNTTDWEQRTFTVPGDVSFRWTFSNSSPAQSRAWVDQVRFTPCEFTLWSNYGGWSSGWGSTQSVTVTAAGHCPWDVVNTNSWITILPSATNSGNGLVNYIVAPNFGGVFRDGYIAIGDQNFYVYQYFISATNTGVSLAEALDTTGSLDWSTIGTPEWSGQNIVSRDGADAAQSGPITHSNAVTATTTLLGPGTVHFWWKVSSETNKDYLKFFINGVQQTRISGEVDWQLLSYNLFSGTNVLKWTYSKNGSGTAGQDRGWLDQVQFVPTPETGLCHVAVSPISALHSAKTETGTVSVVVAEGCSWDVVNTNSWITYTASPGLVRYTVSTNSSRNVRTGVILIGGRPFAVTQLNGLPPCTYSLTSTGYTHAAYASVGSFLLSAPSGCPWSVVNNNSWITITSFSTNSSYVVVNYSVAQNTGGARSGQIYVADKIFTVGQSGATMTLAEALDTVGTLVWDTWSYPWIGEGSVTHDGVDAAHSGSTPNNGSSVLYTTVNGPGTFSFWWKVSSETNYDALRLYLDWAEAARISGEVDWQQRTLTLPAGVHAIAWYYTKDESIAGGQDRGWVDQVQFLPITGCPATLSPANASFPSSSSTGLINVAIAPGCPWGISNPNSWISIVSGSNGTGSGSVAYTVAANPSAYNRSGNIQIADKVFVVTQAGIYTAPSNCSYTVSPNGFGPGSYTGFSGTVFVETPSSCEWNVLNTNAWITITSSQTNFGSGQITFSVSQNNSSAARSGNISVAGQLVYINQSGGPANVITMAEALDTVGSSLVWTPSPGSQWVGQTAVTHDGVDAMQSSSAGGASDFSTTVTGPGTLTFWWKISGGTNGDSLNLYFNGSEQARVSGEVDWEQRVVTVPAGTQTVTWYYARYGGTGGVRLGWVDQVQYISATNAPTNCIVSISPISRSHGNASATNSVMVTTQNGCPWNVVNTNSWVTILSGSNGLGSGMVVYSLAANTNLQARSGNIVIGGRNFLLTQSGPRLQVISRTTTNATFRLSGDAGRLYVIERSDDLIHWTPILTNYAPATMLEGGLQNTARRFYRSVELP